MAMVYRSLHLQSLSAAPARSAVDDVAMTVARSLPCTRETPAIRPENEHK